MKLKTTTMTLLLGALLVGCGGSSDTKETGDNTINLPDGLTMIFFDNASSQQYLYDTDSEKYEDMNSDTTQNYNMIGKHGLPITWFHHTETGVDQKIVMLNDTFNITEGNLTYEGFHYLGHFHEENNEKHFAAHSADEFNPDNNASVKKLGALKAFNSYLLEQENVKTEITAALPSDESLCNFFVFEHEEHEEGEEETVPHIALSTTGIVYVFGEQNGELTQLQSPFALEGVSSCESSKSAIVKVSDHGVLIFSAESQKIYLVDEHGMDFHQHSTWDIDRFLPSGFTPTVVTSILEEGEHDHY
ncbi:MAG: hypothetical protein U9O24_03310 [Campylobacterota bacterium]|nr:hypothetical protein [Campylobacterota bacterium]